MRKEFFFLFCVLFATIITSFVVAQGKKEKDLYYLHQHDVITGKARSAFDSRVNIIVICKSNPVKDIIVDSMLYVVFYNQKDMKDYIVKNKPKNSYIVFRNLFIPIEEHVLYRKLFLSK